MKRLVMLLVMSALFAGFSFGPVIAAEMQECKCQTAKKCGMDNCPPKASKSDDSGCKCQKAKQCGMESCGKS